MDERATAERVVNWFAQRDYEMKGTSLAGVPCSVARTTKFRWIWLGTLQVFVFVAAVEHGLGVELAQIFTEASVEYAKSNKRTGGTVGSQFWVGAIPVLVSSNINERAWSWANQRPPRHVGALVIPAIVNSATRERSAYTGSIVLGAAYAGFLRELVNESVDAALGGRPA